MSPMTFLLLNFAVAFYNLGTIWAHEVDIFRSWKLVRREDFHRVQLVHWRKLPYWVLTPVALALLGSIALSGYHPAGSPRWAIASAIVCQLAASGLTAAFWGRWQAALSKDPLGPESPYLKRILSTHWVRTALVSSYAVVLLLWVLRALATAAPGTSFAS